MRQEQYGRSESRLSFQETPQPAPRPASPAEHRSGLRSGQEKQPRAAGTHCLFARYPGVPLLGQLFPLTTLQIPLLHF